LPAAISAGVATASGSTVVWAAAHAPAKIEAHNHLYAMGYILRHYTQNATDDQAIEIE
jgi:N-formylglutamate amidohydrolase